MPIRTPVVSVVFAGVPEPPVSPELEVFAHTPDEREAVWFATALRPDVLVLSVHPPALDGLAITREVSSRVPGTAVLVLTPPGDGEFVVAAMLAGARGVLSRSAGPDDLIRFIRGVAAGAVVFGERAADRLYGLLAASQPVRVFPRLTSREHEVLDLLAGGLVIAQVARQLGLAPKTVRNVVSSIHAKAGTDDREVLLGQARNAGLGRHS
ncbi:LuxR C-terminal-related transcriptional regulator [Amycolatopsis thailandensis]|uniref:LuxR C-terminal-related transcriptional regulator n=1 Tax=Amycolatopsis thailandensis TaxID=589330 RepID=UPI001FCA2462|nr:response regulator transcription factor [Amycolatopsis thailandensis]